MGVGSFGAPAARKAAAFIGFAIHLMTGWLPGNPWSVGETIALDVDRLGGLLQEIVFGGSILVSPADIPSHHPVLEDKAVEPVKKDRKITKKQLRAEIRGKLEAKEALLNAVLARERQVDAMDQAIHKPFSEAFALCIPVPAGGIRILPVLGLAFPYDKNVDNILFLVYWSRKEAIQQPHSDDGAVGGSLPSSTPIDDAWVSLKDLGDAGAYIVGMDTLTRTPHIAELSQHWGMQTVHEETRTPKPIKGKGKEGTKEKAKEKAKHADAVHVEDSKDIQYEPSGSLPPTLLKIDPVAYLSAVGSESEEVPPAAAPSGSMTAEVLAAIEAQEKALREHDEKSKVEDPDDQEDRESISSADRGARSRSPSPVRNPVSAGSPGKVIQAPMFQEGRNRKIRRYLSLAVSIHADTTVLRKESTVGRGSDAQDPPDVAEGSHTEEVRDPEAVLVLQELRTDGEEPLVMRIQLGSSMLVPLTRATFHIPLAKVPHAPFVFWVRLFSRSSLHLTVHCGAPVTLGSAADLWTSMGGKVLTMSGECSATPAETERLLFRIPLSLDCDKDNESSLETLNDNAICFVNLSRKDLSSVVSLLTYDDFTHDVTPSARLEGCVVALSGKSAKTVIGRCFHPTRSLPSFNWKFLLLHQHPVSSPPPAEIRNIKRFRGLYRPNNRLVLFRDVLCVEPTSPPLALRVSVSALTDGLGMENEELESIGESTALVVRTYRKSDRKIVSEYNARGIVQMYKIDLEGFYPDTDENGSIVSLQRQASYNKPHRRSSNTSTVSASSPAVKKEGAKKDVVRAKKDLKESVEIIVECALDLRAMVVPASWRARTPYEYCPDKTVAAAIAEVEVGDSLSTTGSSPCLSRVPSVPLVPIFQWTMDILGGAVLSVSHDTYDLQRLAAMKNSWEDASEGREERAYAAASYLQERKKLLTLGISPSALDLSDMNSVLTEERSATTPTPASPTHKSKKGKGKAEKADKGETAPVNSSPTHKKHGRTPSIDKGDVPPNPFEVAAQYLSTALELDIELVRTREEKCSVLPQVTVTVKKSIMLMLLRFISVIVCLL